MLFNSYVFMFAFLPAAWAAHALARRFLPGGANAVLALASLAFYGWWDLRFLPLLLGSVAVNFLVGRALGAAAAEGREGAARAWLTAGVAANLAALGFFKYVDFFLGNLAAATGAGFEPIGVILPIGISFFTFQQIAYLVDVREGKSDRYAPADYALFVSFFPQLIAGPIVHHREMMPQFARGLGPRAEDIALGLTIFIAGLFKKVVLADNLAPFASPVFAAADAGAQVSSFEAWGAALAYTFQIYFDFSGYSDMAIGLARLFGVRLPINFHSPYKAGSIIEFWRRWHMTLSRFLRDYLYIRLGGNRRGPLRRHVNLMATMLLGGLWHGAGWGFVIWGALHGLYLVINHVARAAAARVGLARPEPRGRGGASPGGDPGGGGGLRIGWARAAGWALTFLAVVFAWVFFRATTLGGALEIAGAMLGIGGLSLPADFADEIGRAPERLGLVYAHAAHVPLRDWALAGAPMIAAAAALALLAPNTNQVFLSGDPAYREGYGGAVEPPRWRALIWRPGVPQAGAALAAFAAALLYASTISEFLYFQF